MSGEFRTHLGETVFHGKYAHQGAETWEKLSSLVVEDVCGDFMCQADKDQLAQYIKEFKFLPGGRYLYYAGRPNKYFNNCYLLKAEEDTREDWAGVAYRTTACLMTGGGIGVDYSVYRESGRTLSRTGGIASGPLPAMELVNEIGRRVMQGGSRRSAIYASLNWQHGDIEDFLVSKNWHEMNLPGTSMTLADMKEQQFDFPAPLDHTNISVNYDDAWLNLENRHLDPVFLKNVHQAVSTAEPGMSFNFGDKQNETLRNACVPFDTPILTDEGYRPIGELEGQATVIWNGEEFAEVVPFFTGYKPVVRVEFNDGTSLVCSKNHEFLITSDDYRDSSHRRVRADELEADMRLAKFNMPCLAVQIEADTREAYSQGFYSADGNTDKTYSWVYEPKEACIESLVGMTSDRWYERNDVRRKTWQHGVMLDKDWVPLDEGTDYQIHWLAGLLDGDGTVTRDKNGNGFQLSSVDREFLLGVRLLLTTLGVQAKVVAGNPAGMRRMPDGNGGHAEYQCKECFRLLIGNSDTHRLCAMYGLDKILNRLEVSDTPPQRDARRFVKVSRVVDLQETVDTYCFTEPKTNRGTFNGIVTGQCCEVTSEDDSDVCNLGSLNMANIKSLTEFRDVIELSTMFLLCGTLRADLPYEKVAQVREKNRRLGLGLMGMHEWLLQRGKGYEVDTEMKRWLWAYREYSDSISKVFADKLGISQPVANRAVAPTGSIGMLAGTTTGIEPIYTVAYKRRYRKDNRWHYQYAVDPTAEAIVRDTGVDPESLDTAMSLAADPEKRIKFQADVQDWVDMAISSTLNLPAWGSEFNNEDTVTDFSAMLSKYAPRLRGFTCYPDGARGGQPITECSYEEAKKHEGGEYVEEGLDVCDITGKGGTCGG